VPSAKKKVLARSQDLGFQCSVFYRPVPVAVVVPVVVLVVVVVLTATTPLSSSLPATAAMTPPRTTSPTTAISVLIVPTPEPPAAVLSGVASVAPTGFPVVWA
jgi:hypothetical protein